MVQAGSGYAGGDDEIISSAKYPCPYCGNYTFDVEPSGSLEICDVCFWEDDGCRFYFGELKNRRGEKELKTDVSRKRSKLMDKLKQLK